MTSLAPVFCVTILINVCLFGPSHCSKSSVLQFLIPFFVYKMQNHHLNTSKYFFLFHITEHFPHINASIRINSMLL